MLALIAVLFAVGFAAATILGTQAYFLGEQTKPIHERNWKSEGFHRLAANLTGRQVRYQDRASSPAVDAVLDEIFAN
jgi:hypothetical protein